MHFLFSFLGYMYSQGCFCVKQDYTKAMKWFRKAADQGDAFAQFWIGFMYDLGLGVKHDRAEAVKWYRMAADQGDPAAQANLGEIYVGKKDFAEAYFWRKLSEQKLPEEGWIRNEGSIVDDLAKRKKEWVEQQLTAEQRAAIDQRVSEWKPVK